MAADHMDRLFHMADPSFFPLGPWNQVAGHGKKIKVHSVSNNIENQILQVIIGLPRTNNCKALDFSEVHLHT